MKYTIEAIENAKPGMRWEEIGCQWTLDRPTFTARKLERPAELR